MAGIPVRVVVPSHPDSADVLSLHMLAHDLFTPADTDIVVADTSEWNYSKACNKGAEGHNGLLVFLNDDTIPGPNWYQDMKRNYQAVLNRTKPGLIGARSDVVSGPQSILSDVPFDQLYPNGRIVTVAAVIHSEAFNEAGGFDEDFPGWYSDDALSKRVLATGATNYIGAWYIRHFGHYTTFQRSLDSLAHDREYAPLFHEKYGGWES